MSCRQIAAGFSALAALLSLDPVSTAVATPFDVEIRSHKIEQFKTGDKARVFGSLEFIGGLEFTSSNRYVGAFSGLALTKDRNRIVAVTDTGYWFTSTINRDEEGRPVALENGRMAPILNANGRPFNDKWNADAESIAINGGSALISFERDNRVLRYSLDVKNFSSRPKLIKTNLNLNKLRTNKGLETIALAPSNTRLKGATIVVSERSFAARGQIRGAIIDGPLKGRFTVKRHSKFDITDGDFLPNGDLLLLERRFNLANGIGMRIRRINAGKIQPGAKLKGKQLINVDVNYQIDNMEGLSITTDGKGNTYLSLISDNNHSPLQRNLYLEFRLLP